MLIVVLLILSLLSSILSLPIIVIKILYKTINLKYFSLTLNEIILYDLLQAENYNILYVNGIVYLNGKHPVPSIMKTKPNLKTIDKVEMSSLAKTNNKTKLYLEFEKKLNLESMALRAVKDLNSIKHHPAVVYNVNGDNNLLILQSTNNIYSRRIGPIIKVDRILTFFNLGVNDRKRAGTLIYNSAVVKQLDVKELLPSWRIDAITTNDKLEVLRFLIYNRDRILEQAAQNPQLMTYMRQLYKRQILYALQEIDFQFDTDDNAGTH